jgi:hypothetical protein
MASACAFECENQEVMRALTLQTFAKLPPGRPFIGKLEPLALA